MAEILAIAAASLQLSEIFLKLSTRGGKLIIRLKSSRSDVELKSNAVEDFQKFCESSRRLLIEHGARFDEMIQPSAVLHIKDLLRRAESIVDALDGALSELYPQSTDGRYEALRKSIRAVQKTEGIATQLNTLADIQSQLNTYFIQHILALMEDRGAKTETGLVKIHSSQTQIEKTLVTMDQRQSADQILIDDIKRDIGSMSGVHQSVTNHTLAAITKIDNGFASLKESTYTTQMLIKHTGNSIEDLISRKFQEMHMSLRDDILSNIGPAHLIKELNLQPVPPRPVLNSLHLYASPICPCQRSRREDQLMIIGPITIVSQQTSSHQRECQFYGSKTHTVIKRKLGIELSKNYREDKDSYLMRFAVVTSSFLSRFILITRFVDEYDNNTPGFRHITNATSAIRTALGLPIDGMVLEWAQRRLSREELQECRALLKKLHNSLLEDFRRSQDWVSIQTLGGKALLHALSETLKCLWAVQEEVYDVVNSIIHLLVKGRTSITATTQSRIGRIMLSNDGKRRIMLCPQHTALSSCIFFLRDGENMTKAHSTFLQLLAKYDIPAVSSSQDHESLWMLPKLFSAMPDLAFEYGCSRLCRAVIGRRQGELEYLLNQGETEIPSDPYTPLLFAVDWIPGIKILLKTGADPSQSVHCAIIHGSLESLKLLLQEDTWYFRPENTLETISTRQCPWRGSHECSSLIEVAVTQYLHPNISRPRNELDTQILQLLIDRFSNARIGLMRLAKKHLTLSQLEDSGWCNSNDPCCKLDSAAGAIYRKLLKSGVMCSRSMFPGTNKTIYHSRWITSEVAEGLWWAGFHEIDEYDEHGMTPLWLNIHKNLDPFEILRTCNWFVLRGAKKFTFPALNNIALVHKLAAVFAEGHPWKHRDPLLWLPSILQLCAQYHSVFPRDDCVCYCSNGGCSQITSLIKHVRHWNISGEHRHRKLRTYSLWETKTDLFRLWMDCCPQFLPHGCAFSDLCRIELFDRLGMRHTCCKFEYEPYSTCRGSKLHVLEYTEAVELREEDTYSEVKLRSLMRLYEKLCLHYENDFETFWKTWWIVLDSFVPEARFSTTLSHRPIRILPEYFPLPFDSLHEALLDISKNVTTSMNRNLGERAILSGETASRDRRKSI